MQAAALTDNGQEAKLPARPRTKETCMTGKNRFPMAFLPEMKVPGTHLSPGNVSS